MNGDVPCPHCFHFGHHNIWQLLGNRGLCVELLVKLFDHGRLKGRKKISNYLWALGALATILPHNPDQ